MVIECWLGALSTRPLWYDELWRAHYLSASTSQFWHEITRANAPSAFGWVVVERTTADLFGWTPLVLRLPELITLPFVGVSMYALTRRFTGQDRRLRCAACSSASRARFWISGGS